jgi:hypothetical protein
MPRANCPCWAHLVAAFLVGARRSRLQSLVRGWACATGRLQRVMHDAAACVGVGGVLLP